MASFDNETRMCPHCGTSVGIKISYGIYPERSMETAYCPVCGCELFHKNITGDIDTFVENLDETVEPYKSQYLQRVNSNVNTIK